MRSCASALRKCAHAQVRCAQVPPHVLESVCAGELYTAAEAGDELRLREMLAFALGTLIDISPAVRRRRSPLACSLLQSGEIGIVGTLTSQIKIRKKNHQPGFAKKSCPFDFLTVNIVFGLQLLALIECSY